MPGLRTAAAHAACQHRLHQLICARHRPNRSVAADLECALQTPGTCRSRCLLSHQQKHWHAAHQRLAYPALPLDPRRLLVLRVGLPHCQIWPHPCTSRCFMHGTQGAGLFCLAQTCICHSIALLPPDVKTSDFRYPIVQEQPSRGAAAEATTLPQPVVRARL